MRPTWLVAVVLVCGAAGCGGASRLSEHATVSAARPVLTTAASEEGPAASGPWLAWMQSAGINPVPPRSTTDVFVRKGARTVRVNPPGTYALTGGIAGQSLVLQMSQGGRSRLAVYNLATGRLRYVPSFVNDGSWLWRPDIDGHRILYGAIIPGRAEILAYEIRIADLQTRRVRVLLHLDGHADYAAPGQLRSNWATWVSCPDNVCNIWRENIATGHAHRAPPIRTPSLTASSHPALTATASFTSDARSPPVEPERSEDGMNTTIRSPANSPPTPPSNTPISPRTHPPSTTTSSDAHQQPEVTSTRSTSQQRSLVERPPAQ